MLRFFRTTLGLIISLFVLVVSFLVFAIFIATKSHPDVSGIVAVPLLRDSLSIYRNPYGIPHIVGNSDADAFFGIGYVHAQDRLWQMDLARRAGQGRLSEIFGRRTLDADMLLRPLGIHRTAAKLYEAITDDSRMALQSYANGVNAYIQEYSTRLPFEFDALHYKPDPWKPEDCLIVGRMMAWELNMAFWTDAALGEIASVLGDVRAQDLVPSYPSTAPTVVGDQKVVRDTSSLALPPPQQDTAQLSHRRIAPEMAGTFAAVLSAQRSLRNALHSEGSARGSNSWVIRKNSREPSGVILANDPHLTLTAPPRWYEAHLTSPTMNVVGFTIPGLPFVFAGRNDDIAWGITNMMVDDCDYFIEKIDSTNKRKYITPSGASKSFVFIRDTIGVRDSSEAIIDFRYTDRSAVISDGHPYMHPNSVFAKEHLQASDFFERYALTYSWTGHNMSDEILAMYRLQKAKNWEQFLRAVNIFTVPGLNFSYADVRGNYGIAPAAAVPKRGPLCTPNFPNPGWDAASQWQGVYLPTALPRSYNPPQGFVSSANNKTAASLPFHVSSLWEPASRALRIHEMLSSYEEFSEQEAAIMQMDVTSPHAQEILRVALPLLRQRWAGMDEVEQRAFDTLRRWNAIMDADDPNTAIYTVFLERLTRNIFEDELGERLFLEYAFILNLPMRRTLELMQGPNTSPWFDDVRTKKKEMRTDIVFRSFREAIAFLRRTFASHSIGSWNYGALHQLTLQHPLSEVKPLDKVTDIGPFPLGGDVTTINNAEWKFEQPFRVVLGPSMRLICDMQDSTVQMIVPGGNSGQPLSAHYANQMQLWLNGGFITIPVSRTPAPSFTDHLVLVPRKEAENGTAR